MTRERSGTHWVAVHPIAKKSITVLGIEVRTPIPIQDVASQTTARHQAIFLVLAQG